MYVCVFKGYDDVNMRVIFNIAKAMRPIEDFNNYLFNSTVKYRS